MPYTKFAVVIMGVAFGFMFDARMKVGRKIIPMLETVNWRGWLLCTVNWLVALAIFSIGILMIWQVNVTPSSWSQVESDAFITFYRPLFCLAVVMLIWPTFFGYSEGLKEGFGGTIFLVMSRLTYGVFLTYPLVITALFASTPYSMDGYPLRVNMLTIANFFVPWLTAFICYMTVEEPCRKLLQMFYGEMKWANKKPYEHKEIERSSFAKRVLYQAKGLL